MFVGPLGGSARYGCGVKMDGTKCTASHAALEQKLGRPLRPGYEACHTCDTPGCVNWDHLWEGTRAENLQDMHRKGRDRNGAVKGKPKHPGFGKLQSVAQRTSRMRVCSCGREMNAGALAGHQKATGHG